MIPFTKRFPELGPQETRTAFFPDDDGDFPRGKYAFVELYCEEEDCDCRRVMLTVIEESTPGKILATISFGWDPPQWFTDETDLERLGATASGAFLDPLSPQSEHAAEFLDLFEWMITQDPAYLERLNGITPCSRQPNRPGSDRGRRRTPRGERSDPSPSC